MTDTNKRNKTHCPHGIWMNNGGPYECAKCAANSSEEMS